MNDEKEKPKPEKEPRHYPPPKRKEIVVPPKVPIDPPEEEWVTNIIKSQLKKLE